MKLALHQGPSPAGDIDAAFDRIETLLAASARAKADMLLLPELFLPGYNQPEAIRALAQTPDGPWMAQVSRLAREAGCGLTLGWAERQDDAIFNAASSFDANGDLLAHYRKIQLYGAERDIFQPGAAPPPVFRLAGHRAGLLICYDIEFPQHAAGLAGRGADLLLVPTANPAGFGHVPQVLVPARAHENRLTVAYANLCGDERGLVYDGGSVVSGPDARPIVMAGRDEALMICTLPDSWDKAVLSAQDRDYRAV
ncbi:carbon-nitrogen hydrolase family protein [Paracoccus shanxieyensis]|uniref:Nitrilase n=1 Tax=Paracoccus shanxieyensis TaxID=2675752 RepID=A0A6L6IWL9_9RHOB|nr:nitrilase [Paracoccus shanxieyensis]MTH86951.1 nitrilase [Paracoccus shanxieyensis]